MKYLSHKDREALKQLSDKTGAALDELVRRARILCSDSLRQKKGSSAPTLFSFLLLLIGVFGTASAQTTADQTAQLVNAKTACYSANSSVAWNMHDKEPS